MINMCRAIDYYWQSIRSLSQEMYQNFWTWFCTLFVSIETSMASLYEENRRRIGIFDNSRKTDHRWNVSRDSLIHESKYKVHKTLWHKQKIFVSHVSGRGKPLRIGNVTKVVWVRFQMVVELMKNSQKIAMKTVTKETQS